MNNKSRIALAIAAAFGTIGLGASSGAVAQTSSVQIGGGFNMFYSKASNNGGPGASLNQGKNHDNLSLSEPELWIHGEEKIGGMTAWFRCSSSFDLMGTCAQGGQGNFCGRNSALGFKGNFGNVFFGTWDTPHKLVSSQIRGWFGGTGSLTGGFANLLYGGSGSNIGNNNATFYERRSRTISYHSPSFSGFNVKGIMSAGNENTVASSATTRALSPRMWGLSAEYENGPLYIGLGYERHKDHNPSRVTTAVAMQAAATGTISTSTITTPAVGVAATGYNGGEDTSWNLGARYTFSFGTRLAGIYTSSRWDVSNTETAKKNGWAVFAEHTISGPHTIRGQYYKVGDTKGNAVGMNGCASAVGAVATQCTSAVTSSLGQHQMNAGAGMTGAKGWSLVYSYAFSKRTEMSAVYGVIDNDTFATYSKGVSTAPAGSTQKLYGLNIRHRF
jgi:predicted porin